MTGRAYRSRPAATTMPTITISTSNRSKYAKKASEPPVIHTLLTR